MIFFSFFFLGGGGWSSILLGSRGCGPVGPSPVQVVSLDVGGNLGLPLVPIVEQLLLVVQQLLMRLRGELNVGALDDGIHGAGLLAEAAVDTLGHVDVIAGGPAAAIISWLSLDGDGLGSADGLAELARNAALLPGWVPAQCVLPTEARAQRALLQRVVDGGGFPEQVAQGHAQASEELSPQQGPGCPVSH